MGVEVKCPICTAGVIDDGEHRGRCPFCGGTGVLHLDEVDDWRVGRRGGGRLAGLPSLRLLIDT